MTDHAEELRRKAALNTFEPDYAALSRVVLKALREELDRQGDEHEASGVSAETMDKVIAILAGQMAAASLMSTRTVLEAAEVSESATKIGLAMRTATMLSKIEVAIKASLDTAIEHGV